MYYIYIMSNVYQTVFYIGMTNNLERRIAEHKSWEIHWFTQKYNITKLIYFEEWQSRNDAIAREKQLKWWTREKKSSLIKQMNPTMKDLA
jgi:predicted GIY-YIG superfamily endonuclease